GDVHEALTARGGHKPVERTLDGLHRGDEIQGEDQHDQPAEGTARDIDSSGEHAAPEARNGIGGEQGLERLADRRVDIEELRRHQALKALDELVEGETVGPGADLVDELGGLL